ncbi:P-loop containing nucleoside triphosphate hydrolase protein [Sistotremastrum suecicum HHB10207 ss-3]|uniref:Structural maintenance of chromosomes protein 5 n=1 Tax=Sistotremastrum suecicum HHB10207 ss-3 TaxID=1314776 RepID=A0A166CJL9_9AGAM|nr:P-loop containing nucleoside triphosphate hydrolase protein [Sistotremastrum suecicum HHB10207 ss-3]
MVRRHREQGTGGTQTDRKPIIQEEHEALEEPEAVFEDGTQQTPRSNGTPADDDTQENGSAGTGGDMHGEEGNDEEPAAGTSRPPRPSVFVRDVDGFVAGSIVRMKLHNFVTYDDVEFRPGPHLNMILGPNGTGKSSLACALCIGLGHSPSLLGRASELSAFVKHGCPDGFIEIELKGPPGEGNTIVRRLLQSTSRGSTFELNGQHATAKVVAAAVKKLNASCDNLCSFLPQDKVSEFARMTPQQLLKETQNVAGDPHLTEWHQTLIEAGKELAAAQKALQSDRQDRDLLQQKNDKLKHEVEQYKQRVQLQEEIQLYELLVVSKTFQNAKEHYQKLKKEVNKQKALVKQLKERNKPLTDFRDTLRTAQQDYQAKRQKYKKAIQSLGNGLRDLREQSDRLESDADSAESRLKVLKRNEKARQGRIVGLTKEIAALEDKVANPPDFEDLDEIKNERDKYRIPMQDAGASLDRIQFDQRANIDAEAAASSEINRINLELRKLDSVDHQKLEKLRKWDHGCADAVEWLRHNRNQFRMEIFEPPILSVSVPDSRYTDAVESCFGASQFRTFVAQCDEDYRKLNHVINDSSEALGHKGRINVWYKAPEPVTDRPMNPHEMHQVGFDGYALEFVQCPEGMKYYLCTELQMHRTAISLNPNIDLNLATEMVLRADAQGRVRGATYIAGRTIMRASKSQYGQRLAQTSTNVMRQARNLAAGTVDLAAKKQYEDRIAAQRRIQMECEERSQTLNAEEQELRAQCAGYEEHIREIKARFEAAKKVQEDYKKNEIKLGQIRGKLEIELKAPSSEQEAQQIKAKLQNIGVKKIELVHKYKSIVEQLIVESKKSTEVGLMGAQVKANLVAIEALIATHDRKYTDACTALDEAKDACTIAKDEAQVLLDQTSAMFEAAPEPISDRMKEMEQTLEQITLDELHNKLAELKSQLGLNLATNADVIRTFENREREIESLNEKIEKKERAYLRIEKNINTAKAEWLPALQELVDSINEKFSAAFDRIGCAGEVRISENEDYEKWAIDILVKFRDNEKLQLLTAQRQSGGERSLTTILYLMSLTSLARAPFSLVDEINQGMDARAERAVHGELVAVTCTKDSGQYFLITPKLLNSLDYHEKMKILCVNNGEWCGLEEPDAQGNMIPNGGNMMNLINRTVELRTKA